MVKWEHMKAMDYLREPSTKSGGKRGGGESRAVVFRGVGAGGGAAMGPGPVMDLKSEMSAVTEVSCIIFIQKLGVAIDTMCNTKWVVWDLQ